MGGPSVSCHQPAGYWAFLNFLTRTWVHDKGENQYRRGMYTYWQRTFVHPSLLAFDAPSREEAPSNAICPTRRSKPSSSSTTPPTSKPPALAERAIKEARRRRLHQPRLPFGRRIATRKPEETKILAALFDKHLTYQGDTKAAEFLCRVGERAMAKDIPAPELAAWMSVTRVVLNLHETITRE
ncbi:MAG: DUF1553 domain-containing protein [Gemmataceae bacterium]